MAAPTGYVPLVATGAGAHHGAQGRRRKDRSRASSIPGRCRRRCSEGTPIGKLKVWRNDNLVLNMPLKAADSVGKGNMSQRAFDAVSELMIGLFRAGAERL